MTDGVLAELAGETETTDYSTALRKNIFSGKGLQKDINGGYSYYYYYYENQVCTHLILACVLD